MDFDKPEASVNRISVMNLDEPWQQQFSTDFPGCRLEEQAGMSREDLKFMKIAKKVFSQQDQEPKKRPFAHFKGKSETGPPKKTEEHPTSVKLEKELLMHISDIFSTILTLFD